MGFIVIIQWLLYNTLMYLPIFVVDGKNIFFSHKMKDQ
jgi:hypothetical protein